MLEYAVVLLAIRKAEHKVAMLGDDGHSHMNELDLRKRKQKLNYDRSERAKAQLAIRKKNQFCYEIDRMAFVTFAASFGIFNIVYIASYP